MPGQQTTWPGQQTTWPEQQTMPEQQGMSLDNKQHCIDSTAGGVHSCLVTTVIAIKSISVYNLHGSIN